MKGRKTVHKACGGLETSLVFLNTRLLFFNFLFIVTCFFLLYCCCYVSFSALKGAFK